MNPFLEHATKIHQICRKHQVAELYLFGSMARGNFDAGSDIDLLVEFDWREEQNLLNRLIGLKDDLEKLLLRKVDLVCASAMRNPFLKKEIEETKQRLFAA